MPPVPDHLQIPRYRVTFRCVRCGHQFKRTVKQLTAPDPPCPKEACKEAVILERAMQNKVERARLAKMLREGRAPGSRTNVSRAADLTANIVMEDHKLTNLRDDNHEGESSAPKLHPRLQAQVDGFFGAPKPSMGGANRTLELMKARAMAGSFAPPRGHSVVDALPQVGPGQALKPKIKIIAG